MLTRKMYVSLLVCLFTASAAFALEVIDSRYSESLYTSFAFTGTHCKDIAFDSSGNLYAVSGDIMYKITPDGTASVFVTGLSNTQDIVYGGGTAYGDKLYIANHNANNIICVELDGTKSVFSSFSEAPLNLTIDRGSNFDGKMYVGTDSSYGIWSVTDTGSNSLFKDISDFHLDMTIDSGTRFGGKIYQCISTGAPDWIQSIVTIDPDGTRSIFIDGYGGHLDFDTTPYANYGGDLYSCSPSQVRRIAPDSSSVEILHRSIGMDLSAALTFGSDGAMYLLELDTTNDMAYVWQVTPEPMTLSLLAVGGLALLKRRRF